MVVHLAVLFGMNNIVKLHLASSRAITKEQSMCSIEARAAYEQCMYSQ